MSALASAASAVAVLGLIGVFSAGEILRAGGMAPRTLRLLDRAAAVLFLAFFVAVGSQVVGFL